jgi:PKHD-type hydroxylase
VDDPWKQHPLTAKSVSGVFTAEQCETIKNYALAVGMSRATVLRKKKAGGRKSQHRTSDQAELPRTPETEWIFERVAAMSEAANAEYWRFALTGIEAARILRYKPMQYFRWHFDTFPDPPRKLTCIVNLSTPQSYWRGGLEVKGQHAGRDVARLQGAGTWFPTYLRHRATAPWWGERWVLVGWLGGPAWT